MIEEKMNVEKISEYQHFLICDILNRLCERHPDYEIWSLFGLIWELLDLTQLKAEIAHTGQPEPAPRGLLVPDPLQGLMDIIGGETS